MKKITILAVALGFSLLGCKKEVSNPEADKETAFFPKPKGVAGLPGGTTNYLVQDGNNFIGNWGGATLTFTQILYPTGAQQGQLCNGYSVSTDTGEISGSDGIIILALPSFVAASGSPIQDFSNYSDALDNYFKNGGSMPSWSSYVSPTYGPVQTMGCFVIVDFNSPSGFTLVSTNNSDVKPAVR
ncbi:hypothetical protein [Pedobacter aquatilis]|uniref:hypothetical protein n=1 Tax=Pedobacter aquatilis TaxID=351343 RepID=UPI00292EFC35|nr:hypothetical protein [Pedobacter aquatilis]